MFSANSCEHFAEGWYIINFKNLTDKYLYIYCCYNYARDTLPQSKPELLSAETGETVDISDSYVNDRKFKKLKSGDTLSVFVFNKDTLSKYDWQTIQKGNKYETLLKYSNDDLNKIDFIIYYYGK